MKAKLAVSLMLIRSSFIDMVGADESTGGI